ncbi:hypothetical protein RESH_01318 [Rhodopirellula europaea SH398]|uniref:Uncharacterized protein n=1 Tax=Rhodopirellula europaea SH398 TaxID=1263868 RepID=M5SK28_9BACT|nr:hypothetical protein RESH_01318 [Rhodopirellula europaea SH398]
MCSLQTYDGTGPEFNTWLEHRRALRSTRQPFAERPSQSGACLNPTSKPCPLRGGEKADRRHQYSTLQSNSTIVAKLQPSVP